MTPIEPNPNVALNNARNLPRNNTNTLTPNAISRLFKNASKSLLAANTQNTRATAKLERTPSHAPLDTHQRKKSNAGMLHIRFVSVRKRLLDPDNLSEKWLLDCLRNCGAITGDEPDKITLETTQRKTVETEEEFTEITIFQL